MRRNPQKRQIPQLTLTSSPTSKLRKFTQSVQYSYETPEVSPVKSSKFHNLNKMPFMYSTGFLEDGDNIALVPFWNPIPG